MAASAVVIAVLIGVLIAWKLFTRFLVSPASTSERHVTLVVPEGARSADLVALLGKDGLVADPGWFEAYVTRFRRPIQVNPGEYALATTMSPSEILDRIERGAVVTYTVTIPPGWRASRIIGLLAEHGLGREPELRALLEDPKLPERLGLPAGAESIEGFLFPDAYSLPKGLSAEELLSAMVARYKKTVTKDLLEEARAVGLDELQLITLASLIETDRVPADERTQVAGVYHNRLKQALKLENPATVAYGLGKDSAQVVSADVDRPHPWNTYANPGLPPTPIASPSLAAIQAAARPAKSDALFFAPSGDATHVFCPDEVCHRLAVQRWQKEQAQRPGTTSP